MFQIKTYRRITSKYRTRGKSNLFSEKDILFDDWNVNHHRRFWHSLTMIKWVVCIRQWQWNDITPSSRIYLKWGRAIVSRSLAGVEHPYLTAFSSTVFPTLFRLRPWIQSQAGLATLNVWTCNKSNHFCVKVILAVLPKLFSKMTLHQSVNYFTF